MVHVPQKAGDVLIYTEALTHRTLPWQGAHKRSVIAVRIQSHGDFLAWI